MANECFLSLSKFFLVLLIVYGIVGIALNTRELDSLPNKGKWPFNQSPIYKTFIGIQCFYFLAAGLGFIGILKKDCIYFYLTAFTLLAIFMSLFVFGIICLRISSKDMNAALFSTFRKNQSSNDDFEWISDIQWEHNCCGIHSFLDWRLIPKKLPTEDVPDTCCITKYQVPPTDCGKGILKPSKTFESINDLIYTEGCGDKITPQVRDNIRFIGLEMLIVSLVTFGVSIFIYCGVSRLFCFQDEPPLENVGNVRLPNQTVCRRPSGIAMRATGYRSRSNVNNNNSNRSLTMHRKSRRIPATPKKRKTAFGKTKYTTAAAVSHPATIKKGSPNWSKLSTNISEHLTTTKHYVNTVQNMRKHKLHGGQQQQIQTVTTTVPLGNFNPSSCSVAVKEDMLRNKLEMLYYSIEKNTSAMSTTPNPSGSIPFTSLGQPTTEDQNRQLVCSKNNADKTLVLAPNLGHYSSLPLFHLVKLPTGELGTLGQFSPHFHNHNQQKHTHTYDTKPFAELNSPVVVTSTNESETNVLASVPINANVTYTQSKFLSHDHSSTLATIQEESESIRSGGGASPAQNNNLNSPLAGGASPAVIGCHSPLGSPSTTIIINDLSNRFELEDNNTTFSDYLAAVGTTDYDCAIGAQIDNNGVDDESAESEFEDGVGGDTAILFRAVPSIGSVKSETEKCDQINENDTTQTQTTPETVVLMDWNCASDSSSHYDVN